MKLFGRRKQQNIDPMLPPELQAYSRSGRRERLGIVWLVGIVSLIISLLVMALLYFGGRWIYRKVAHRDNRPTPVIITDQDQSDDSSTSPESDQQGGDSEVQPDDVDGPEQEANNSADGEQSAPSTQPVTGDTSSLPNTGPEFDL